MANIDLDLDNFFPEPERPPSPEPSISVFVRENKDTLSDADWKTVNIRLVGSHPLWAHHLWNAAKALATYLDEHVDLYYKKNVLELGAGGGLPSIVTALNGAGKVVLTDYPDDSLVDNMLHNVRTNLGHDTTNIVTRGYIWGRNVDPLVSLLEPSQKFDLLILSDLIFNHSQHDALLKTALETLSPGGVVLVFYTHHRPHLAHRDMQFFELAKDQGWQCEEVLKRHFDPMFPEDPGDAEVRSTVHGWSLKRHELL